MRSATFLHSPSFLLPVHGFSSSTSNNAILFVAQCKFKPTFFNLRAKPDRLLVFCYRDSEKSARDEQSVGVEDSNGVLIEENVEQNQWNVEVGSPSVGFRPLPKLSLSNKAFLLLTFIALTVSLSISSNLNNWIFDTCCVLCEFLWILVVIHCALKNAADYITHLYFFEFWELLVDERLLFVSFVIDYE